MKSDEETRGAAPAVRPTASSDLTGGAHASIPGHPVPPPALREIDPAGALTAPNAPADEEASTRERVARSILEHGPSTAASLGQRLHLTPAAIRRHLGVLLDHGLVSASEERVYGQRGRGRPAKVFALTDAGRADFYQAYDRLAIQAMRQIVSHAGPTALAELAEARVAAVEEYYHRVRSERPEVAPLEALTEALNADGYVASVRPSGGGDQLCQHHCPVAHVAAAFPQLCEIETQVIGRLLGQNVQRLATIAHGHGVCTTNIPDLDQVEAKRPHPQTTPVPETIEHSDSTQQAPHGTESRAADEHAPQKKAN